MKVIIAGGRDFDDYGFLKESVIGLKINISEVVSGKAKGADALGEQFAEESNIPVNSFPANWGKHGRSAGPMRNKEMADYADVLIAFWDGKSKGTKSMIEIAKTCELDVYVFYY